MKSPLLFIIYRRPETTKLVFERISEARPPRLYIAADGPHFDRKDEEEKCACVRKIVEKVDWPCEVFRLYRDENLGCGRGVSSAISWFFEHEEQGVIIEDDILPNLDFFSYCDEMLDKFKDDETIQLISGYNYFYDGYKSDISYYKSCLMSIWGWASWRRVWKTYDYDVNNLDSLHMKRQLFKRLPRKTAAFFMDIFVKMKSFEVDTWDYQLFLNQQYYDRYSVATFVNMIENIGMGGEGAAHTVAPSETLSSHKAYSPYPLFHPNPLCTDNNADIIAFRLSGQYKKTIIQRVTNKMCRFCKKISNTFSK